MPSWLKDVLPYVAPFLLALAGGVVTSTALSPRRLRREIADDAALLEHLRGAPRGLLSEDIARRAIHLAAWNRFPMLTSVDLIRIGVITFLVAAMGLAIIGVRREPPETFTSEYALLVAIYPLLVARQWWSIHNDMGYRRHERREFRETFGSPNDEDHDDLREVASAMTSAVVGVVVVVIPPVTYCISLADALDAPDWAVGVIALAGSVATLPIMGLAGRTPKKPTGLQQRLRDQDIEVLVARREQKKRKAQERSEKRARRAGIDTAS